MSELNTYGFRSDKAKEEMPSPSDIASLKANMCIQQTTLHEINISANNMAAITLNTTNKAYPAPIVQLQKIRDNDSGVVIGGVTLFLYRSQITDNDGQPGSRQVQIWASNTNAKNVKAYFTVTWTFRPNGSAFPIGDAWEY